MKQGLFTVLTNENIAKNVYKMTLSGDTAEITNSGQFVNVALKDLFLRRPISVCDYSVGSLTLVYKVVGKGTDEMSKLISGDKLDILTGLGNGYDTQKSLDKPLLIGGGVGVPPLYNLCKKLISEGKKPTVILGFNTQDEIFFENEFCALNVPVFVTTVDGSKGIKGFVTDAFESVGKYSYFYACGPKPMLKAVFDKTVTGGQFSLEERMGCGFGACVGCTINTKNGAKRVCKDGPVFDKEEIIW